LSAIAHGRWWSRPVLAVLAAQLMTALADNALLLVAIAALEARQAPEWTTPALRLGFYASYVLLAPLCGRWADAWPKGWLMTLVNVVKLAGVLALAEGAHPLLVFAAIGCGAAAYAPARYGMLPELTRGRALVQANAAMEIVTVVAILGGTALGSALVGGVAGGSACAILALIYALGAACTLAPRRRPASRPAGATSFRGAVAVLAHDPAARHSLVITSIFWAAAAVLQLLMIAWAREAFGLSLAQAAFLPAVFACGLIAGAVLAGSWAALARRLRPHLCGFALGGAILLMPMATGVATACTLLLAAGLLAGALLVPMNATLQERGARLLQPGLSVAVQNFLENGLSILFLGAYGAALACGATLDAAIHGLGLGVILLLALASRGGPPGEGGAVPHTPTTRPMARRLALALRFGRVGLHLLSGLGQCALLFPLLGPTRRLALVRRWSRQLVRIFGITLEVRGDAGGAGALVANHVSWLDVFVLNAVAPCRFIAKSEVRQWPAIGWLSARAGTLYIARRRRSSLIDANAGIARHLSQGERLAFFPEGTSGPQGALLPFHANLFQAVIAARAPLLPVAIAYVDADGALSPAAEYIGDTSLGESMVRLLTGGPLVARLCFLPPIDAAGLERRALAALAHAAVSDGLEELVGATPIPR